MPNDLAGLLTVVGGVSGAALLLYMSLMLYFNRRKEREIVALRIDMARIEGILLGRTRRR